MPSKRFQQLLLIIPVIFLSAAAQQSSGRPLSREYQKWLNEDVYWILTSSERTDFLQLTSDQARDKFVIDFWERRNPNPTSKENAFKEEHYRRLEFANKHFAAAKPGWRTDRGHVYIVYGPPDSVMSQAATSNRPADEIWVYRHLGAGEKASLKFVDECQCGDYKLTSEIPGGWWRE